METDYFEIGKGLARELEANSKRTKAIFEQIYRSGAIFGAKLVLQKYAYKGKDGKLYTPGGGRLLEDEIGEVEEGIKIGVYRI